MSGESSFDGFSAIFFIAILFLTWTDSLETFGSVVSLGIFVAVFGVVGATSALERYLKKTKSERWMHWYRICGAVVWCLPLVVMSWIGTKKIGTVWTIGIFAAFGLLFALEWYLWRKTKSEQWMSRYHISLAVAIVLAVLVGIFLALRYA